jgi:hypothetical protein
MKKPVSRLGKPLALAAISGTALVVAGCVVSPSSPSYNAGAGYNAPGYAGAPVDVSDLRGGAANHAKQQFRARGFRQVGQSQSGQFHNTWWLNANTKQCFQLEASGGQVMTINQASPAECQASGQQNPPPGNLPQAAQAACLNRFGEPGYQQIKTVSPLKPGYWEVIITGRQGRQVACTVDQYGSIADWVNM